MIGLHFPRVGVIGSGRIGSAFVERLIAAGYEVVVWNRSARATESFAGRVTIAASPAEACHADVVLCTLLDDAAVKAVVLDDTVLAAIPPTAVFLSVSTISLQLARELEATFAGKGLRYVGAPVFGIPESVRSGEATLVVGGDTFGLPWLEPTMRVLGNYVYVGDRPHVAHLAKLGGNFLIGAALQSLAELHAMMAGNTTDAAATVEAVCGILFRGPVYARYTGVVTGTRPPAPSGGLALPLKDLRLAIAAGETGEVAMPLAAVVESRLSEAQRAGFGASDWAVALATLALRHRGSGEPSLTGVQAR